MEKWIAKAVSGDPEALQLLFAKKGYSVYKYALDRTGQRDIAKNVTKEVFNSLHKNLFQNHAEAWTETDLDRFLITRTRELCDSFQDLASIQGELFGASAKPALQAELYTGALPEESEPLKEQNRETSASPAENIPQEEAVPVSVPASTSVPVAPAETTAPAPAVPHLTTEYPSPSHKADTVPMEDISSYVSRPVPQSAPPAEPATSREKIARLYDDPETEIYDENEEEYEAPSFARRFFFALFIMFLIVCILVLFWVIAGILMDIGWIPSLDLGYEWFNENIYPLF